MRLTPCPACARHVRSDAGVCPFCDHALSAPSGARAKVGAVLLGVATVSTLTACPRHATKYGGPPVPMEAVEADSTPPGDSPEPAEEDEVPEGEAPEAEAPEAEAPER